MTHPTLTEIAQKLKSLPSFLTWDEVAFALSSDTDGSWHALRTLQPDEHSCSCEKTTNSDTFVSSRVLLAEPELWSDCLLKVKVNSYDPGFFQTFEDLLFVLTAAEKLEGIENWETYSFEDLIELAWALTAVGLFNPPSNTSGIFKMGTGSFLYFKDPSVTGASTIDEFSSSVVRRLLTTFERETLEFLGGSPVLNPASSSAQRVVITMDYEQYGSFWVETSALIRDADMPMTLTQRATGVLKSALTAIMLGQVPVGLDNSFTFAVPPGFLPALDVAGLNYTQIFKLPESMSREEFNLFTKFTEMYHQKLMDAESESLDGSTAVSFLDAVVKPAWASFEASIK